MEFQPSSGHKSEEELEAEEAMDELADLQYPPMALRPESEQRVENMQRELQRMQMHIQKVSSYYFIWGGGGGVRRFYGGGAGYAGHFSVLTDKHAVTGRVGGSGNFTMHREYAT